MIRRIAYSSPSDHWSDLATTTQPHWVNTSNQLAIRLVHAQPINWETEMPEKALRQEELVPLAAQGEALQTENLTFVAGRCWRLPGKDVSPAGKAG